jgi:hypothetical protein
MKRPALPMGVLAWGLRPLPPSVEVVLQLALDVI